jgi:alkanesulfonate monooxygenase SsuD/methylene tetrahydromethanopterin reductase-like flavin-dependent oxidoreductase (luciferase family)
VLDVVPPRVLPPLPTVPPEPPGVVCSGVQAAAQQLAASKANTVLAVFMLAPGQRDRRRGLSLAINR